MSDNLEFWSFFKWPICLLIGLLLFGLFFGYLHASMQAEAYHRAGIELTTWECFMGVKPPEIVIHQK